MILTKEIKLKTKGLKKKQHYIDLGYDVQSSDYIIVKIEDLLKASGEIIEVICSFCKKISKTTYHKYNCSVSNGNGYSCDRICARKKAIISNIKKYGVENVSQVENIKKKKEKTSLKNWGTNHPLKSEYLKEKMKEDNLEKWGSENVSQVDSIKEKKKKTTLKNWGVENPFQSEYLKDKIKEDNIEKYGVNNPMKSEEIKEKSIKTNIVKYGVKSYTQTEDFKMKSKESSLLKWGVEYYTQTEDFKMKSKESSLLKWGVEYYTQTEDSKLRFKKKSLLKWGSDHPMKSNTYRDNKFKITSDVNYIKYLIDSTHLFKCEFDHDFEIHSNNYYSRVNSNINLCTICNPIGNERSFLENDIFNFIKSNYNGEIIQSYRDGLEIDIYLPDLKLGFEFNGLYWHSEKFVEKNYHLNKTNYFKDRGIQIIHIWEDDWTFKNNVIKSQISNRIGLTKNKIFARKCQIKEVNINESRVFLDNNHIQGYVNTIKKIGLYYNDELVSLMTFDNFEGRKKMEDGGWNLSRFCNKLNTNVIGGASKLFKHFIKNYNPSRIVSYADKDWSQGDLYYTLGFENINESKPDYKYIVNKRRVHKSGYQKSKLKTEFTESKQMKINGFNKVWDCGKIKFQTIFT